MSVAAEDAGLEVKDAAVDRLEPGAHLLGEPVDLLIDADDALGDELDLAHQVLGHHIEVPASLRVARRHLGPQRAARFGGACGDLGSEVGPEVVQVIPDVVPDVGPEVVPELVAEFVEAAIQVLDEFLIHAATISA